ncbi:RNA binding-protein [Aureococcus anophagefferens]|nr:RNA binding-protein [Aureococcus anophagefferens]
MADSHQYMTSGAKRQKVDEYAGYAAQAQYGADKAHQKQASAYEFSQHKMNTAVAQSSGRPAPKIAIRHAAGKTWRDDTLEQWPEGDFRLFVGNIGNEVIRNKHTNKSKGFAFISFMDPFDCAKALREMTGKYIGNRPCKLMKSTWNERTLSEVRKRDKKKRKAQQSWGISS